MKHTNPYNLKNGYIVRRFKAPFFIHYGLVFGFYPDGSPMIAEFQNGIGVQIVDLATFLNGEKLYRPIPYDSPLFSPHEIQMRVNERKRLSYHISKYNCEVFVNDVLYDRKESLQVRNGAIILAISLSAWVIKSDKSKRA